MSFFRNRTERAHRKTKQRIAELQEGKEKLAEGKEYWSEFLRNQHTLLREKVKSGSHKGIEDIQRKIMDLEEIRDQFLKEEDRVHEKLEEEQIKLHKKAA